MTSTLVIVPCGSAKIWSKHPHAGPTEARAAYVGSPFVVNRQYAERFADEWVVLSAKYGFLRPTDAVAGPYNVTFKDQRTNPIAVAALTEQIPRLGLERFTQVIGLGFEDYRTAIAGAFSAVGIQVRLPFAGLNLFQTLAATKRAVDQGEPEPRSRQPAG